MLFRIADDPETSCYRTLLLANALNWRTLGQSREGWLTWVLILPAEGLVGRAVRSCYRDLRDIVLFVWGQAS